MANKTKVSITLNDTLTRFIDLVRGDVPRSKFIENYLKDRISLFEVIWIYSDELNKLSKKELIYSRVSQTLGKPLHRYEGFIDVNKDSLDFYDTELSRLFSISKLEIKNLKVGYDKDFKSLLNSKGMNPPMHFSFGKRKMYIFTRPLGGLFFKGENEIISQTFI